MSGGRIGLPVLVAWLLAASAVPATDWENPVFQEADDAVRAGLGALAETTPGEYSPGEMFTLFTLSSAEVPGDPRFADVRRQAVDSFLVTFPSYLSDSETLRTLESFLSEVEGEKSGIGQTMGRFGFPPLPGLTYLKLVENVDELQESEEPTSERTEQINGVTYYCRYVVIPLSYISARALEELRVAALDPSVDVEATLRAWERESFRVMVSTFRHEMVHVWANSSLGPPRYRDRERYPTWFLEGSATFLAADPYAGLSERYQGYQDLFNYLVESHGVRALRVFFGRILADATVQESLTETYGIASSSDLRQAAERWHDRKAMVSALMAIALLLVVVLTLALRRLPVFGSLQLWLAVNLGYATFSGFCESTQALSGATAVLALKGVLGAAALFFGFRGLRSIHRFLGRR